MIKNSPLVSVIIPTYNRSDVIYRAIKSALNQSYRYLEIIIVDDGSTDDTENVINSIKDSRIRYIKHTKNYNGAVARNTGIDEANGEFIAFLDSDDEWLPEKLERQLITMLSLPCQSNIVCYSQLFEKTGELQRICPERGKKQGELLEEYLFLNDGLMQTSTLMMHRSAFEKVRFNPVLIRHQDWDLCLQFSHLNLDFIFINEPLVIWNDDQKLKRVSKQNDFRFSLNWISSYKGKISEKAYNAFVEKIVNTQRNSYEINEKKRESLLHIIKDHKIAIYGAGYSTQYILSEINNDNKERIIALIDRSSDKQGKKIQGITIYDPALIPKLEIDLIVISVDRLDVSTEIYKDLENKKLRVLDLNQMIGKITTI